MSEIFINHKLYKDIVRNLSKEKLELLNGNKGLQLHILAVVARAIKHHYSNQRIKELIKMEFDLFESEQTFGFVPEFGETVSVSRKKESRYSTVNDDYFTPVVQSRKDNHALAFISMGF